MCMRNLNATILTCIDAKRSSPNSNTLTYNNVFDIIVPKDVGGKLCVSEIDIVVDLLAIFDENREGRYIEKDTRYECMLAVTFDGIKYNGIGEFDFCTESSKLSKCGDRSFYSSTLVVREQSFDVPENATQCDLVLLIKHPPEPEKGKWVLQTIKRLHINKPIQ